MEHRGVLKLHWCKDNRSSAEGIKKACVFQVAAIIIEYINKETLCHINLPVGEHVFHLTHEAQAIAKNLMLSQAQLCFYEMAVRKLATASVYRGKDCMSNEQLLRRYETQL